MLAFLFLPDSQRAEVSPLSDFKLRHLAAPKEAMLTGKSFLLVFHYMEISSHFPKGNTQFIISSVPSLLMTVIHCMAIS